MKPKRCKRNFEIVTVKMRDYIKTIYHEINCQPVGQRLPVTENSELYGEKAEGIIRTILNGDFFGTITCVKLSETEIYECGEQYDKESLDGGHRKRYSYAYSQDEFACDGKKFSELSEEDREDFLDTDLHFCIYEPLTTYQKGKIFRDLNTSTDVNFMEMLNSYGNIPIANYVRESVRSVDGVGNAEHRLFEMAEKHNRWIDFTNSRLIHDQYFARIVYRYTQSECLGGGTNQELSDMYNSDSLDMDSIIKKSNEHLDFLLTMATARKKIFQKGLTKKEFKMLSYVYFYLQDTYGYKQFKIPHTDNFYKAFKKGFDEVDNNDGKYGDIEEDCSTQSIPSWETRSILLSQLFSQYVDDPKDTRKVVQTIKWLLMEFDIESVIISLDKKRNFTRLEKERKLSEQGYVCAIDGKPLIWEDAHAAHIVAHVKGGETIYSNLAMVRTIHNLKMGDMNLDEYKETL